MDGEGEIFEATNNRLLLENAGNWHTWKFQVKVILKAVNVYDVVDGSSKCPEDDDKATWKRSDAKAQAVIVSRLGNTAMLHVQNCETAKEIWDKLNTIYEQKSDVSLHILQQRFFEERYNTSEDVSTFVARIESLVAQIRQAKGEIAENMIVTKIISSVGEKFRHFVSAWDSVPVEKRNLSELTARLIIEEQRITMYQNNESSGSTAFKSYTKTRKCFNCGRVGHYKKDCKAKKNKSDKTEDTPFCKQCKKRGHTKEKCWYNKGNKQLKEDEKQNAFVMSVYGLGAKSLNSKWYLDSGASEHMCFTMNNFTNYKKLLVPKDVVIGDGTTIKALGYGDIDLEAYDGEKWINTLISNVLYVPSLKINLFSMSAALDKGYKLESTATECHFIKNSSVYAVAKRYGKMYTMLFRQQNASAMVGKSMSGLREWHAKLGHQDINQVKSILIKHDIKLENSEEETCLPCLKGKQHKFPFPSSTNRATKPGEVIHIDIGGQIEETSLGGAKYFLLIKDDYSKYRKVYFLKNKGQSIEYLKQYLKEVQVNPGHIVKYIRSDNAKEFISKEMENLLKSYGIQHQRSVSYTPQQNGCVEREMRTVIESARTMLLESGLNKNLWAEAINTAVYIINRTGPSRVKDKTPYELWWNKEFDINNLKVFGSQVSIHIPDQKRVKFDSKAELGYFIGYGENTKGYRIYFPERNIVDIKRDIVFIKPCIENKERVRKQEKDKYYINFDTQEEADQVLEQESQYENRENHETIESEDEQDSIHSSHEQSILEEEVEEDIEEQQENSQKTERPRRASKKPSWFKDYVQGDENMFLSYGCDEPISYQEAMIRPDKGKWEEAINKELKTLEENNTWEEVTEVPDGENIISSKWVFKVKEADGKALYKARLVARGFQQKNCDDQTYSPVAKLTTFKTMMAVATQKRQPVYQMDVTGAFLYGDIDGELYSGTVADFSGMEPIIYREPLQTEPYDSMTLNAPDFVNSLVHGNFVYFFFRETAVEYINCGKSVFSRVARVCRDDRGGPHRFKQRWTSFLKSRLNCSVAGDFPFYFNEIQSTTELIEGVYGGLSAQLMYGTFTTPPNSISGSAVCAFSMQDIADTFEGTFKEQSAINSNWLPVNSAKVPEPRPGTCNNNSRQLPDQTLNFIKTHALMDESVPAFFGEPIVIRTSFHYRFTQIAVDPQVKTPGGKAYDVLFIGTDNGKIIKAINAVSYDSNKRAVPVVIEELQAFAAGSPVRALRVARAGRDAARLIAVSDREVLSLRLHRCSSDKISSCSECVALQDPYCAWDKQAGRCRAYSHGVSRWLDENSFYQSVSTGSHSACPHSKDAGAVGGLSSGLYDDARGETKGEVINIVQDKDGKGGNNNNEGPEVLAADPPPAAYSVETLALAVAAGALAALGAGFAAGYICGRRCKKDEDDNMPYPDTEYEYFEQRQNINRIQAEPKLLQQVEEVTYAEPVLAPQPKPASPRATLRKHPPYHPHHETLFQFQPDAYRRDNFGTLRSHQVNGDGYRRGNDNGFSTTRSVKKVYL